MTWGQGGRKPYWGQGQKSPKGRGKTKGGQPKEKEGKSTDKDADKPFFPAYDSLPLVVDLRHLLPVHLWKKPMFASRSSSNR